MAVLERVIDSDCLGRSNKLRLFVPESGKTGYSTVYLQHGLGDDESTPWTRTKLEQYASEYELIVVTSDAGASWFCNDIRPESGRREGRRWEDYFAFELPEYVESNFPAAPVRSARGQCGFSMGGYGAMMLALLHPDRFGAVSTHSGSFVFGHEYRKDRPERAVYMKAVAPPGGRYDLFARIEKSAADGKVGMPALRMDVGDRDHLLEQNRKFHSHLISSSVEHLYFENKGEHTWSYVDAHLQESLSFFSNELSTE